MKLTEKKIRKLIHEALTEDEAMEDAKNIGDLMGQEGYKGTKHEKVLDMMHGLAYSIAVLSNEISTLKTEIANLKTRKTNTYGIKP